MEANEPRFENMPTMVAELINKVTKLTEEINSLKQKVEEKPRVALPIDVAAQMLCKSKSTIYKLVAADDIPFHKQGKRLYFFEDELMEWITTYQSPEEKHEAFHRAQVAAYGYLESIRPKSFYMKQMKGK